MEQIYSPERAIARVLEKHPSASAEQKRAFVCSVEYALTGHMGGVQCSMREHRARELIEKVGTPGTMSVEKAISLCEEVCFGPLTLEIASMYLRKRCNDASEEIEKALRLLGGSGLF